jgi:hypothetical protein
LILTGIYCFSIVGISTLLVGASSTSGFARGEGRGGGGGGRGVGRGGGRGYVGGRGYGRGGGVYVSPGCYWNYGVRVYPY